MIFDELLKNFDFDLLNVASWLFLVKYMISVELIYSLYILVIIFAQRPIVKL